MKAASFSRFFVASLVVLPLAALLAGQIGGSGLTSFVRVLFALTVAVEVFAFWQAAAARKLFSKGDPGYLTWTLILAFLIVRLIAEARLLTLTFGLVAIPSALNSASAPLFIYVVVFRYLYTFSDALFIGALITAVLTYKRTGLRFSVQPRDYLYILLLWSVPVVTYMFRDNLGLTGLTGADPYISNYRLVAVIIGAVIASLCVVVRRYAIQMGGGAVARVWNTVVAAGIARDASFLTLALLSRWWGAGATFTEQYLLWIFACCWLIAALRQREVVPATARSQTVPAVA
jgi:hypothetical protein